MVRKRSHCLCPICDCLAVSDGSVLVCLSSFAAVSAGNDDIRYTTSLRLNKSLEGTLSAFLPIIIERHLIIAITQVTSELKVIATTKEEYIKIIDDLKSREPKSSKKPTKAEIHLLQLREKLENRLEAIDHEINASVILLPRKRHLHYFEMEFCLWTLSLCMYHILICLYFSVSPRSAGNWSRRRS